MYSYLTDGGYVDTKAKGMKKPVIKCEIKFKKYKNCLENNDRMLRSQQRFNSEAQNVFAEKVKILLSSNDGKRLNA